MINRQKLDLIDAAEKRAKLQDFITKTMNGCEHQNYIETLIKKNDTQVIHNIDIQVLEESIGNRQIYEVDLISDEKKNDKPQKM